MNARIERSQRRGRAIAPFLLAAALLAGGAACGDDEPSSPDAGDDTDVGVIVPPDADDTPHCIDVETDVDIGPECEVDDDCVGVLAPIPMCRIAECADGECVLADDLDGTACDDGDACTDGESCVAGECIGGTPVCECATDADCQPHEDGDRCNGTLVCDLEASPSVCVVDSETVVTCAPSTVMCQVAVCDPADGTCSDTPVADGTPCDDDDPCTVGDACRVGVCEPGAQNVCACPAGMVPVAASYCIDQYEASRPDATAGSYGTDTTEATSRPAVLPWFPVEYAEANQACRTAGKRLCTVDELQSACAGPAESVYPYGDAYEPSICNGIDTYCDCESPACSGLAECPYPHCYNQNPDGSAGGCGAALHPVATGTFVDCTNAYGAFDLSGNVWELVDRGDGASWYVGGAYNCLDSEALHRCDGVEQNISAKGFRCCADYGTGTPP